ncbi:nicotinamide riboside kinase [Lasioglossum baleicum]|uniref:nicotinamide riboside kinase n=1 Tax=Lasioglossum baleicum TaxID=434251 RepID=UPI003FCD7B84
MSSKNWIVLGISGATCSGKTSLVNRLHKELKNSVLICQDNYFLPADDPRHTYIPELNHMNWEIINSLDMDKMRSDVLNLITSPEESKSTNTNDKKILILDGFLLFTCKVISKLCNKKYFLTLTKDQCWERRKDRCYDPPDVPGYFEKVVWPEYAKHTNDLMKDKDLYKTITFIDGSKSKEEIFQIVSADIKKLLS